MCTKWTYGQLCLIIINYIFKKLVLDLIGFDHNGIAAKAEGD